MGVSENSGMKRATSRKGMKRGAKPGYETRV